MMHGTMRLKIPKDILKSPKDILKSPKDILRNCVTLYKFSEYFILFLKHMSIVKRKLHFSL